MAKFEPDDDLIRRLAALLEETGLSEIEFEADGKRIRVGRGGGPVAAAHLAGPAPTTHRPSGARPRALQDRAPKPCPPAP